MTHYSRMVVFEMESNALGLGSELTGGEATPPYPVVVLVIFIQKVGVEPMTLTNTYHLQWPKGLWMGSDEIQKSRNVVGTLSR